jgi:hypothetical protein
MEHWGSTTCRATTGARERSEGTKSNGDILYRDITMIIDDIDK